MKFSIKDFFSKCDQIRSFMRIWSHLPKKSLMENFIFFAVIITKSTVSILMKVFWIILHRNVLQNVVMYLFKYFFSHITEIPRNHTHNQTKY